MTLQIQIFQEISGEMLFLSPVYLGSMFLVIFSFGLAIRNILLIVWFLFGPGN